MKMPKCTLLPKTIKSADKDPETQRISYEKKRNTHRDFKTMSTIRREKAYKTYAHCSIYR